MLWGNFLASITPIRKEENLKSILCPSQEVRKEQARPREYGRKNTGENREKLTKPKCSSSNRPIKLTDF